MFANQLWHIERIWPAALLCVYLVLFFIVYRRRKHVFTFNLSYAPEIRSRVYTIVRHVSNGMVLLSSISLLLASIEVSKVEQQVTLDSEDIYVLFAIDISPSMAAADFDNTTRIATFQEELNGLLDNVKNKKIGVLLFSEFMSMVVPFTDEYEYVRETIDAIRLGTLGLETALTDALVYAYSIYASIPSHRRIMVVVTDGNQNSGSTEFNTVVDFFSRIPHFTVLLHMGSDTPVPFTFRDPNTQVVISGILQPSFNNTVESFASQSHIEYHSVRNTQQLRTQLTRILYSKSSGVYLGVDAVRVSYTDFFLIVALTCFLIFLFIRHILLRVLW